MRKNYSKIVCIKFVHLPYLSYNSFMFLCNLFYFPCHCLQIPRDLKMPQKLQLIHHATYIQPISPRLIKLQQIPLNIFAYSEKKNSSLLMCIFWNRYKKVREEMMNYGWFGGQLRSKLNEPLWIKVRSSITEMLHMQHNLIGRGHQLSALYIFPYLVTTWGRF